MGIFGTDVFDEGVFGGGLPPDVPRPGRVAWTFYDGVDTYEFLVNPDTASMPTRQKNLTFQATTAGRQVPYEGRPDVGVLRFSGVILHEAQYHAFKNWVSKRKQVQVKDDLDQRYWVYLKNFLPTRVNAIEYPWMMNYSIEGVVLDRG